VHPKPASNRPARLAPTRSPLGGPRGPRRAPARPGGLRRAPRRAPASPGGPFRRARRFEAGFPWHHAARSARAPRLPPPRRRPRGRRLPGGSEAGFSAALGGAESRLKPASNRPRRGPTRPAGRRAPTTPDGPRTCTSRPAPRGPHTNCAAPSRSSWVPRARELPTRPQPLHTPHFTETQRYLLFSTKDNGTEALADAGACALQL